METNIKMEIKISFSLSCDASQLKNLPAVCLMYYNGLMLVC